MNCLICCEDAKPYITKHRFDRDWTIDRCASCGFGFVSNRPTPEELNAIYASFGEHMAHGEVSAASHDRRADAKDIARRIKSVVGAGHSLDVGCGDGAFSYHLARLGFTPTMIDLDPRSEVAAKLVPASKYHSASFEDFSSNGVGVFKAIVMSQVLEHALDPMDWLKRAAALLDAGGALAVAVPNFGGPYRVLGTRDPFLTPPLHLNFFTPRAMRIAIDRAGLRMLRLDSRNEISLSPAGGLKGAIKRSVATAWNILSMPLNGTSRGIILRAFATR